MAQTVDEKSNQIRDLVTARFASTGDNQRRQRRLSPVSSATNADEHARHNNSPMTRIWPPSPPVRTHRGHLAPRRATFVPRPMSDKQSPEKAARSSSRQEPRQTNGDDEAASSAALDTQLIRLRLHDELSRSSEMLTSQQQHPQQELDTRLNSSSREAIAVAGGQEGGVVQRQQQVRLQHHNHNHNHHQHHNHNHHQRHNPQNLHADHFNQQALPPMITAEFTNLQCPASQYPDQYFYQEPQFYPSYHQHHNHQLLPQGQLFAGHFQEPPVAHPNLHHNLAHSRDHDLPLNSLAYAQQTVSVAEPQIQSYQRQLTSSNQELEAPSALSFVDLDEVTRQQKASSGGEFLPESVIRMNDEYLSTSSNKELDSCETGHQSATRELAPLNAMLESSINNRPTSNSRGEPEVHPQLLSQSNASSLANSYNFCATVSPHQRVDKQLTSSCGGSFSAVRRRLSTDQTRHLAGRPLPPVPPATTMDPDFEDELMVCEWLDCGNTFMDMGEFVKHLEEQHVNLEPREKNRYFCLWLNCKRNKQEFNARYKLLIHMRVHSGEKPYSCQAQNCSKSFSRLENLKIHVRSHTGEKPYRCNYQHCAKSFTNSSDRIKHHKTHEDPKPYNCTHYGCNKRYTDPSSLRKHLRAHKRSQDSGGGGGNSSSMDSPVNNRHSYSSAGSQQLDPHSFASSASYAYLDPNQDQAQQQQQHDLSANFIDQHDPTCLRADYDPAKEFASILYDPNNSMASQEELDRKYQTDSNPTDSGADARLGQSQFSTTREQPVQMLLTHQQLSKSWSCGSSSACQISGQLVNHHNQRAFGARQQTMNGRFRSSVPRMLSSRQTNTIGKRHVQFEPIPSNETLDTSGGLVQSTLTNNWQPNCATATTCTHEQPQHQRLQVASDWQLMHSMPADFF